MGLLEKTATQNGSNACLNFGNKKAGITRP